MTEQTAPVAPINGTAEVLPPAALPRAESEAPPEVVSAVAVPAVETQEVETEAGEAPAVAPQLVNADVTPQSPSALPPHGADGGCCGGDHGSAATVCQTEPSTVSLDVNASAPDELTLLGALKQVIDPELFVNVVDLGLIYAIHQDDGKVVVDMTLTSPACPAGPQLVAQAKQALEAVPGIKEASIKLVMTPPWSPDRMTDDARDHLGIF